MMTSPDAGCTKSKHTEVFGDCLKMATEIISADGQIVSCLMCMKHFGVEESELISDTKNWKSGKERNSTRPRQWQVT